MKYELFPNHFLTYLPAEAFDNSLSGTDIDDTAYNFFHVFFLLLTIRNLHMAGIYQEVHPY